MTKKKVVLGHFSPIVYRVMETEDNRLRVGERLNDTQVDDLRDIEEIELIINENCGKNHTYKAFGAILQCTKCGDTVVAL